MKGNVHSDDVTQFQSKDVNKGDKANATQTLIVLELLQEIFVAIDPQKFFAMELATRKN
jgi:hypothetical protein